MKHFGLNKGDNMKRIFFNIDNSRLDIFESSHAIYLHNNKDRFRKGFDYYIRGILSDKVLYLRYYYPYEDIDVISFEKLKEGSRGLLNAYKNEIVKKLKAQGVQVDNVKINVSNEDLKTLLNTQYV